MKKPDKNTEQKILDAAEKEFIINGMTGTRMHEIASRAGINKALLHYYFRSKEKLFMAVFNVAVTNFVPKIYSILIDDNISLFDKIRIFIDKYTAILMQNPFLPMFILQEINRNPGKLVGIIKSTGINPDRFIQHIEKEIKSGAIRSIDPRELIVNMLSLCIFPVGAKPMLQPILFNNDKESYERFLKERAETTSEFIINSIKA